MTWIEIKKTTDKNITMISTDNALESIATSAISLTIYDIPFIIINGELPKELINYDGVILQYMDAVRAATDEENRGFKYHYIFSDHGISYFPEQLQYNV